MEYHIIVINIFLIFALILVGFVAGKAHLVSEQASKDLSAILVEITLPASIFSSMLRELETDLLINAALLFFIGFACLALEYGAGRLLVKFFRIRKENQGLFLYNSMFTNASFMGFPVANAIFGSVGVFLASIVNLSLTITTFSFGIGLVRGDQESKEKFSLRKNIFTNINIAIILGMICFLTGFRFPEPAENFIAYFANVTTPMSMLVVGLNMSKGRAARPDDRPGRTSAYDNPADCYAVVTVRHPEAASVGSIPAGGSDDPSRICHAGSGTVLDSFGEIWRKYAVRSYHDLSDNAVQHCNDSAVALTDRINTYDMATGRNVVYNVSISELTIEETVHCSKNNMETVTRKSRKKKKYAGNNQDYRCYRE